MRYGRPLVRKSPSDVGDDVEKLIEFWEPAFAKLNWADRLQLLEQIDEEIEKDWRYDPKFRSVSASFTARLIDRLGRCAVLCGDQADFYSNSVDASDQDAAHVWFQQNPLKSRAGGAAIADPAETQARSERAGGPVAT